MACAIELKERGIPFTIYEASDRVGGRVKTDTVDGFLLDQGFQIFLTSYPEAQRILDYKALDLQPFYPGALVRWNEGFHRVADPFRVPVDAVLTLLPTHPIGSIVDKILVGVLRLFSLTESLDKLYQRPDMSIEEKLTETGFSSAMIDRFFRPFLGGIFFDNKLRTTARELDFVFRMLALGENCLPSAGIGAVSDYMASLLPAESVQLSSPVKVVAKDGSSITLSNGKTVSASAVVVATEGDVARKLLETAGVGLEPEKAPKQTMCLYYSIDGPAPTGEPVLYLNGDGVIDAEGTCTINNMCFPSNVAPSYAPADKSLVSVSLIGIPPQSDTEAASLVQQQLKQWFGPEAQSWKFLKAYRIPYCQPNQEVPSNRDKPLRLAPYLFVTGDHRTSASLEGALRGGTLCGEAVWEGTSRLFLAKGQAAVDKFAKAKGLDSVAP